ncbi:MAG: hypothetical protein IJK18_08000 [Clostridia bacterium]|nr:hypothetical protein [Clostridia bacterium]
MLRIILMSLFWGLCATCLVRPWFWIGVIRRDLYNHGGKKIGFDDDVSHCIFVEIVGFIVAILISILEYSSGSRYNLWGSFIMIIFCSLWQCWWSYQGKLRYTLFISIAIISAILWIQDYAVGAAINTSLNKVDSVELVAHDRADDNSPVKLFVSANEIANLFKVNSATGPTYSNGKYIFEVSGGDTGDGVVVINKNDYTKAYFIPCSYRFDIAGIRSQFPTAKLKKLFIAVSDDDVPYGVYAISNKTWLLGTYKVDKFALRNLQTGEVTNYYEEPLPEFVKNK